MQTCYSPSDVQKPLARKFFGNGDTLLRRQRSPVSRRDAILHSQNDQAHLGSDIFLITSRQGFLRWEVTRLQKLS